MINWSKIPANFKWVARNANGAWYAHPDKPKCIFDEVIKWRGRCGAVHSKVYPRRLWLGKKYWFSIPREDWPEGYEDYYWCDTLTERPEGK